MKALVCFVVVVALVGACTDDPSPPETRPPSPTQTPACANQSSTIEDEGSLVGQPREDDVDGDGARDTISIHIDPTGDGECRTFLTVETGAGRFSSSAWLVGGEGGLPEPRITAIVDIDSDGYKEVILDEATGASTQFVGVYRITAGGLVWVRSRESHGLFAYGGSVGHLEAIGCAAEGMIVASSAIPAADESGETYKVRRRIFSLSTGKLEPEKTEHHSISIHDLERFPEYRTSPFGNCGPN
jgi:hypothetical protein